jgi:FkbM family methyltransferase
MKLFKRTKEIDYKKFYSQNGEDVVLLNVLKNYPKNRHLYLDIGANHPVVINNTYLLYENGFTGVSIEPNKFLCDLHKKYRPMDTIINSGIGEEGTRIFYQLNNHTLCTFSKEEADAYVAMNRGYKIEKTYSLELESISGILDNHFSTPPVLVSIDVEGMEMEILKMYDFDMYSPEYFIIETYSWAKDCIDETLFQFMRGKGFIPLLSMGANTIFKSEIQK